MLVSAKGGIWFNVGMWTLLLQAIHWVLITVLYLVVTEVHLVYGKLACIAHRLLLTDYLKISLRRTSCHKFQAAFIFSFFYIKGMTL